jgi:hypothetical protein
MWPKTATNEVSPCTLRGIVRPIELLQFGFVQRLYAHTNLQHIKKLQALGYPINQIAAVFNRSGRVAINNTPWDTDDIIGIIRGDEFIRRQDAYFRTKRLIAGPESDSE